MSSRRRHAGTSLGWCGLWVTVVITIATPAYGAIHVEWRDHFGGTSQEFCFGIAATAEGVYATGQGSPGGIAEDSYVRKYQLHGGHDWTAGLAADVGNLQAQDIDVSADGLFVVASLGLSGDSQGVLMSLNDDGDVIWSREFGTDQTDHSVGVGVNNTGVFVAGRTSGEFPGEDGRGPSDGFIRKYDFDGNVLWTDQFGTTGADTVNGMDVSKKGAFLVGYTDGAFPGGGDRGGPDVFVRRYANGGVARWTRQYGSKKMDVGHAIAARPAGVVVAGQVRGGADMPGAHSKGGDDGFVSLLSRRGKVQWTRHVGGGDEDGAYAVAASESRILVGGQTSGEVAGPFLGGNSDAFLAALTTEGKRRGVLQIGTAGHDSIRAATALGPAFLACGHAEGPFADEVDTWSGEGGLVVRLAVS